MKKISTNTVIIGAGVTGLTLAHHLNKDKQEFVVLEKNSRIGGVIKTLNKDGFIYEQGPNTGLLSNPEIVSLFDDIKHLCELEIADDTVKRRLILKEGKWRALPSGLISAVTTPLFSLSDKFRVLGEPFRKAGKNPHENLKQLVERRLGKSFYEYAIDPFILGVYAGDPELLIPKYALPKLYNLEQKYGSFIKGSIKKAKEPKTELEKRADKSVFSFKNGLSSLTNALYKSAGEDNFILNSQNIIIEKNDQGYTIKLTADQEYQIQAKNLVTTIGAHSLSNILHFIKKDELAKLSSLKYARVVEAAIGFKTWNGMKLEAFGGLIPHKEKRDILGVMFMSSLLKGRAPEGGALLSVFAGGVRNPNFINLPDNEIKNIISAEVKSLMKIKDFNPELFEIKKYHWAIPQYGIESKERFETIDMLQKKHKGLIIAGNLINGIGMADRIAQGTQIFKLITKKN